MTDIAVHVEGANIATGGQTGKLETPPQRFSMPEFVDWHMILDHELSQLTRPETGVIGSVGFVGLGGALSMAPGSLAIVEKTKITPPVALVTADIATIACFVFSAAIAAVCLVIFGLSVWRNKGLAGNIRARKKKNFPNSSEGVSSA